jgi:NAD(P)H-hydrate epimerase
MVRCHVHAASVAAVNAACPQATAVPWDDAELPAGITWCHAAVIGPGFGLEDGRRRLDQWLSVLQVPVVLDADALTAYAGEAEGLGRALGRRCVITPHATEAARLLGVDIEQVRSDPYAAASVLSAATGATVLLKGVPSIVAAGGRCLVIPRGTPVLGAGGSGDLLAGMTGALLIQSGDPVVAACVAAFVHGRAAEIADPERRVRGFTLEHVLAAMPEAWYLAPGSPLTTAESGWLPRAG